MDKQFLPITSFIITLISANHALGAPHSICVHFDLDNVYRDASPASDCDPMECIAPAPDTPPSCCDFGETFGRRDTPDRWAAPRLLVRIRADVDVIWGWRPLNGLGCTPEMDINATSLTLDYLPWSYWNGTNNSVVGLNCDNTLEPTRCGFSPQTIENILLDPSGVTRLTIDDPDGPGPQLATNSIIWAAAFSEERLPTWTSAVTYVILNNAGRTIADTTIGGQPTVNIRSGLTEAATQTYQSKFVISHEYGHVQTALIPVAMMNEMFEASNVDYTFGGGNATHSGYSPEWQSAASLEGFAHYYSALAWWDSSVSTAQILAPGKTVDVIESKTNTKFPRYIDTACDVLNLSVCPEGVAVEFDWLSALWNFHLTSMPPSPLDILRLQAGAFP